MAQFMEETVTDQEIAQIRTEARIAEYLAADPDGMFKGYHMADFGTDAA